MSDHISSGTVTFLFTDIEGSTKLLQKLGSEYEKVLSEHHLILRNAIENFSGKEEDTAGDGFFITFDKAGNAVAAAAEIQKNISSYQWPPGIQLKVRMGIHTGEPNKNETGYVGIDVHRAARIGAAGYGGQVLISESTKVLVSNDLPDDVTIKELGEFNLKDLEKPERIYQLVIKGLPSEFSPIKSLSNKKNNLPLTLPLLIGREKEIEETRNLILQKEIRLLTLTGPGGTGKTSLALNVSESLANDFEEGVYAVFLASISDETLVPSAIAQALGLIENPSKPILESLKDFLGEKKILLFLDNYEQVVSSSMVLEGLLESCPGLKILVTSRIILHLRSEKEYFVPPLSIPRLKDQESIESLSQYSSVRLFIERAKSVKKDFSVTNENAPAIAEICVQLDGLPLAIELASARIKLFTPQMILSRLGSKLSILKSTSRNVPERHQTLRQAILWSYELLSEDEKKIFRWMSVFNGGSTFEAIESIFGKMEGLQTDISDGVEALLDKSLLRRLDDDNMDPRFYMLETIREFSDESLEDEDRKIIKQLYSDYYLALAEEAEPNLTGEGQKFWLNKLEMEQNNFRSCLSYAEENSDVLTGLKLCGSLWRFWIIRGNLIEGYKEINKFLLLPESKKYLHERAKVLNAAGTMVHEISNYYESLPLLEESLDIYKTLNDKKGIAVVLNNISWVEGRLGNLSKTNKLCEEALKINEEIGDKRGISVAFNNIAWLNFFQGKFRESSLTCKKILILKKELRDERGVAFSLTNMAWADLMQGEFETAYDSLFKSMSILENLGDRQLLAWANNIMGILKYATGDYLASIEYISRSMDLMSEIGNEWVIAHESCTMGHLKYILGDYDTAKDMLDKSKALHSEMGSKWGLKFAFLYTGYLLFDQSKSDDALKSFRESLIVAGELSDKHGISTALEGIASVYIRENKIKEAGLISGASQKIRKDINSPLFAFEKARTGKDLDHIIKNPGESILEEGQLLNIDEVLRIASEE